MNSSEVFNLLTERLNRPLAEVKKIGDIAVEAFTKSLGENRNFSIPGFGTFGVRHRDKRKSYSPHHKQHVMLPEKDVVFFRPSKALQAKIREAANQ